MIGPLANVKRPAIVHTTRISQLPVRNKNQLRRTNTTQLHTMMAVRQSGRRSAHPPIEIVKSTMAIDGAANTAPLNVADKFSESNHRAANGITLPMDRKNSP